MKTKLFKSRTSAFSIFNLSIYQKKLFYVYVTFFCSVAFHHVNGQTQAAKLVEYRDLGEKVSKKTIYKTSEFDASIAVFNAKKGM